MPSVAATLLLLVPAFPPPPPEFDLGAAREFFRVVEVKHDGHDVRDPVTNRERRVLALVVLVEARKKYDPVLNLFVVRCLDAQNVEVRTPSSGLLHVEPRVVLKEGERTRFVIPDPGTAKVKKVTLAFLID